MLKSELWPKRCVIYQTKVLAEAKVPLIGMDSVVLWHSATPLSTFESGLPVSSFCLQDNNNTERARLAQAAANLSARSESQGSHCTYLHSPDTLPGWAQTQHLIIFSNTVENWGSLCPVRSSSQGLPLCVCRHLDKDKEPWLWQTSTTLPEWAVASRSTF